MKKIMSIFLALVVFALAIVGIQFVSNSNDISYFFKSIFNPNSEEIIIDFEEEFGNKSMYYYNQLTSEQQKEYLRLYQSIIYFEENCTINVDVDTANKIYNAVSYDNPELFWISYNYKYSYTPSTVTIDLDYKVDKKEAKETTKKLEKVIQDILDEASKFSTDYDKEKYFHDYICKNVVYDLSTYGTTGGLVSQTLLNGTAICEGYAKTMQLLLDRAGIYNYLVLGDVETDGKIEHHMWNVVKIAGENYHLDVTWDDTSFDEEICYMYFNVTDSDILKDHMNLNPSENNCDSITMNYFSQNGTLLHEFSGYNSLVTYTANTLKSGQNQVEFRFANASDYNKAASILKGDNQAFFDYVKSAVKQSGRKLDSNNITYIVVDDWKYIRITFIEV